MLRWDTIRQRSYTAAVSALLSGISVLWGCATSDDQELTRLLRELDAGRPASSQLQQPVISPSAVASPATAQNPVPPSNLTAAPVADHAAAPRQGSGQELTIQPDCVVQISIAEDPSLNGSYPVNDIGAVDLGYIGPVILYNKTEKEAAEKISEVLLNRDFVTATVKVRILKASYGKVKVTGSVRQPGLIRVGAGDTISMNDALLRVGGLAPSALGGKVRVYRGGLMSAVPEAGAYEDYALQTEGGQPCVPNVQLGNNDVASVMPPTAGGADGAAQPLGEKEILVLGEVEKPGFYRFEGSEPCSMLHLLFRVGPLPKFANTKAVKVIRRDASGLETEIPVDAARILEVGNPEADVQLENGDRVVIPEKKFSIL